MSLFTDEQRATLTVIHAWISLGNHPRLIDVYHMVDIGLMDRDMTIGRMVLEGHEPLLNILGPHILETT
tara:strand:+ start:1218 stop:1424 length:207 start_codon:yes stop_codon:yes gene_type:complete